MKKIPIYLSIYLSVGCVWAQQAPTPKYIGGNHIQIHENPRGAYVECIGNLVNDRLNGDFTESDNLFDAIIAYDLEYIAMYNVQDIIDGSFADSPRETELKKLIFELKSQFIGLEIGVVSPKFTELEKAFFEPGPNHKSHPWIPWMLYQSQSQFPDDQYEHRLPRWANNYCIMVRDDDEPELGRHPLGDSTDIPDINSFLAFSEVDSVLPHDYKQAIKNFYASILFKFEPSEVYSSIEVMTLDNHVANRTYVAGIPFKNRKYQYFDWFSVEHEYWRDQFCGIDGLGLTGINRFNDCYQDHLSLLDDLWRLTKNYDNCYQIESYIDLAENTAKFEGDNSVTPPIPISYLGVSMQTQADELRPRLHRLLHTHYFNWPETTVDRRCHQIEAFGGVSDLGINRNLWPIFSAEKEGEFITRCDGSQVPHEAFFGDNLEVQVNVNNYWKLSGIEDEFEARLQEVSTIQIPYSAPCSSIIDKGDYHVDGFMWFTADMMHERTAPYQKSSPLSVTESASGEVALFPNPVSDILNIPQAADNQQVMIYSIEGKLVGSVQVKDQQISLNNLQPGVYLLEIVGDSSSRKIKIIKA